MIENFTLDTDANPQNMNKLIEGINKNEEDITAVKKSVEGVSSQIGQIANERGYVNTKLLPEGSDFNNIPKLNGNYMIYTGLHAPVGSGWYFVQVIVHNDLYYEQRAKHFSITPENYRSFQRNYIGDRWLGWIETPTELTTPIIKNVPAGVTKIKDVPMGIYRIYAGSTYFTDYPPMAKKMSHDYGILVVNYDGATYKTYSLIVSDASVTHNSEYTGFSGNGTEIKWSGVIPYSVNAAGGVTIISQNNYILNGVMHINLTVRKTDSSNFAAGAQYSIAGCPNLILTYPKNVSFTGWNLADNVLIGSGGVGTIFVDTGLYIIPTAACGVLRITGEFLLE